MNDISQAASTARAGRLAIVTPVLDPAPGGGAIYTKLLALGLDPDPLTRSVTILTEAFPGEPRRSMLGQKTTVLRAFPFRAGRSRRDWLSYAAYAWQGLQFLRIADLLDGPDIVLVHSSFHNNPNLLARGLARLRAAYPRTRVVLDVRDPLLPARIADVAHCYDAAIGCSQTAMAQMRKVLPTELPLFHIPIIFEPVVVAEGEIDAACARFCLKRGAYLIATNGLRRNKGMIETIALTRALRTRGHALTLAVVGKARDADPAFDAAIKDGALVALGPASHGTTLALVAGAAMHVNLSRIEGLPRASLEAMWLGTRTLLPPNVPEFVAAVPDLVAPEACGEALAQRAEAILARPAERPRYPFHRHAAESVCAQYSALAQQLMSA